MDVEEAINRASTIGGYNIRKEFSDIEEDLRQQGAKRENIILTNIVQGLYTKFKQRVEQIEGLRKENETEKLFLAEIESYHKLRDITDEQLEPMFGPNEIEYISNRKKSLTKRFACLDPKNTFPIEILYLYRDNQAELIFPCLENDEYFDDFTLQGKELAKTRKHFKSIVFLVGEGYEPVLEFRQLKNKITEQFKKYKERFNVEFKVRLIPNERYSLYEYLVKEKPTDPLDAPLETEPSSEEEIKKEEQRRAAVVDAVFSGKEGTQPAELVEEQKPLEYIADEAATTSEGMAAEGAGEHKPVEGEVTAESLFYLLDKETDKITQDERQRLKQYVKFDPEVEPSETGLKQKQLGKKLQLSNGYIHLMKKHSDIRWIPEGKRGATIIGYFPDNEVERLKSLDIRLLKLLGRCLQYDERAAKKAKEKQAGVVDEALKGKEKKDKGQATPELAEEAEDLSYILKLKTNQLTPEDVEKLKDSLRYREEQVGEDEIVKGDRFSYNGLESETKLNNLFISLLKDEKILFYFVTGVEPNGHEKGFFPESEAKRINEKLPYFIVLGKYYRNLRYKESKAKKESTTEPADEPASLEGIAAKASTTDPTEEGTFYTLTNSLIEINKGLEQIGIKLNIVYLKAGAEKGIFKATRESDPKTNKPIWRVPKSEIDRITSYNAEEAKAFKTECYEASKKPKKDLEEITKDTAAEAKTEFIQSEVAAETGMHPAEVSYLRRKGFIPVLRMTKAGKKKKAIISKETVDQLKAVGKKVLSRIHSRLKYYEKRKRSKEYTPPTLETLYQQEIEQATTKLSIDGEITEVVDIIKTYELGGIRYDLNISAPFIDKKGNNLKSESKIEMIKILIAQFDKDPTRKTGLTLDEVRDAGKIGYKRKNKKDMSKSSMWPLVPNLVNEGKAKRLDDGTYVIGDKYVKPTVIKQESTDTVPESKASQLEELAAAEPELPAALPAKEPVAEEAASLDEVITHSQSEVAKGTGLVEGEISSLRKYGVIPSEKVGRFVKIADETYQQMLAVGKTKLRWLFGQIRSKKITGMDIPTLNDLYKEVTKPETIEKGSVEETSEEPDTTGTYKPAQKPEVPAAKDVPASIDEITEKAHENLRFKDETFELTGSPVAIAALEYANENIDLSKPVKARELAKAIESQFPGKELDSINAGLVSTLKKKNVFSKVSPGMYLFNKDLLYAVEQTAESEEPVIEPTVELEPEAATPEPEQELEKMLSKSKFVKKLNKRLEDANYDFAFTPNDITAAINEGLLTSEQGKTSQGGPMVLLNEREMDAIVLHPEMHKRYYGEAFKKQQAAKKEATEPEAAKDSVELAALLEEIIPEAEPPAEEVSEEVVQEISVEPLEEIQPSEETTEQINWQIKDEVIELGIGPVFEPGTPETVIEEVAAEPVVEEKPSEPQAQVVEPIKEVIPETAAEPETPPIEQIVDTEAAISSQPTDISLTTASDNEIAGYKKMAEFTGRSKEFIKKRVRSGEVPSRKMPDPLGRGYPITVVNKDDLLEVCKRSTRKTSTKRKPSTPRKPAPQSTTTTESNMPEKYQNGVEISGLREVFNDLGINENPTKVSITERRNHPEWFNGMRFTREGLKALVDKYNR